ncbi:hypothetical protein HY502_01325, partial [Candidatus Woesebacteria bacterium]|nr:hypothetical protein [Candidatus Woesebacteria bacterium]
SGCILAPSIEAKAYGVKTGMRVKDGKVLCPSLIVLPPDPWKYRNIHLALRKLLKNYTNDFTPKSIDEFVLNLDGYPCLELGIWEVGRKIKKRIKEEIGEWLTVSVGISTNRFLAKTAASLHKPDGLDEINHKNYPNIYSGLALTDLTGIKERNAIRLNNMGIHSVLDFYASPLWELKAAFASVTGYYWWLRLRGYEIDSTPLARRSYGNSFALPRPLETPKELSPILSKLVQKMATRLRRAGYKAKGVHLGVYYRDGSYWHKGRLASMALFDSRDFYKEIMKILLLSPFTKPVRNLAVSCFDLQKAKETQLEIFEDVPRKENLVRAVDKLNKRFGNFTVKSAKMIGTETVVLDRIAFGGVKELEEFARYPQD